MCPCNLRARLFKNQPVIGRPILYRTSKEFLMRFGLSDLDELPSLKEFEQLARAALGSDEGIAPTETENERSVAAAAEPASATPPEPAAEAEAPPQVKAAAAGAEPGSPEGVS